VIAGLIASPTPASGLPRFDADQAVEVVHSSVISLSPQKGQPTVPTRWPSIQKALHE